MESIYRNVLVRLMVAGTFLWMTDATAYFASSTFAEAKRIGARSLVGCMRNPATAADCNGSYMAAYQAYTDSIPNGVWGSAALDAGIMLIPVLAAICAVYGLAKWISAGHRSPGTTE